MGNDAPHPLTGFVMDDDGLGPHGWAVFYAACATASIRLAGLRVLPTVGGSIGL